MDSICGSGLYTGCIDNYPPSLLHYYAVTRKLLAVADFVFNGCSEYTGALSIELPSSSLDLKSANRNSSSSGLYANIIDTNVTKDDTIM